MAQNLTLGRGKLYFSRFKTGTQQPEGYRYLGNTPEFGMTIDSETLDHFSSDAGIREKDASVPLEVSRTGTIVCDDIQAENVALFFFGTAQDLTVASATGLSWTQVDVKQDRDYQIGWATNKPAGDQGLTNVVVKVGVTVKTITTDYTIDLDTGMLHIVDGGTILDNDDVTVEYDVRGQTRDRILSGAEPIEGALYFREDNPHGKDRDLRCPWVKITPNGDLQFKGDEWRQIPFSIEALKPESAEAIYIDGRPAYN